MTTSSRLPLRSLPLIYTLGALLLAITATPTSAQSRVFGTVVDDANRQPINTVDVSLLDGAGGVVVRALTNTRGEFRLVVPDSGDYSLSVRRVGYAPILAENFRIGPEDEFELEIRLDPSAIPLEAVTVVAQRSAVPNRIAQFRERAEESRRLGRGRVYMRDDLARLQPNSAQEILDGVLWGARCRPNILLDGLPVEGRMTAMTADLLEGIEIYRGVTQIPPEYYRYGMCGLAMVWTRVDPPGMRPFSWGRLAIAGVIVAILGLLMR